MGKGSVHYTLYRKVPYLDSARMALEGSLPLDTATHERCGGKRNTARSRRKCESSATIMAPYSSSTTTWNWKGNPGRMACISARTICPLPKRGRILGDEYIIGGTANAYEDVKTLARRVQIPSVADRSDIPTKAETQPYSGFGRI